MNIALASRKISTGKTATMNQTNSIIAFIFILYNNIPVYVKKNHSKLDLLEKEPYRRNYAYFLVFRRTWVFF